MGCTLILVGPFHLRRPQVLFLVPKSHLFNCCLTLDYFFFYYFLPVSRFFSLSHGHQFCFLFPACFPNVLDSSPRRSPEDGWPRVTHQSSPKMSCEQGEKKGQLDFFASSPLKLVFLSIPDAFQVSPNPDHARISWEGVNVVFIMCWQTPSCLAI